MELLSVAMLLKVKGVHRPTRAMKSLNVAVIMPQAKQNLDQFYFL